MITLTSAEPHQEHTRLAKRKAEWKAQQPHYHIYHQYVSPVCITSTIMIDLTADVLVCSVADECAW